MGKFAKLDQLPTIEIDEDSDWVVQFQGSGLPDGAELAMTKYGLFVQVGGRFLSLDVAELLDLCENDGQGVDEPLFVNVPGGPSFAELVERIGAGVRVVPGAAPVVLTGKEITFATWAAGASVEYPVSPERLIVANGRDHGDTGTAVAA